MSNCSCLSDETLPEIALICGNFHIPNLSYCLNISLEVVEIVNRYNDRCAPSGSKADKVRFIQSSTADKTCNITLHVHKDMKHPIYVYYQLDNLYIRITKRGKDSIEQDCILQHHEDHNMAARLATIMFNSLKGRSIQGRVYQRKEPLFVAIFQPMVVLKGSLCKYRSHHSPKGAALEALLLCRTTVNFLGEL
uniref:Villin-3-like isoform X1 n=1 Tax=Tanacetum cinerariifolium TaxID=118510 RepID=A0A699HHJ0_TANCI|nr:villin-3-like isoform X1 [Tanacetum cinerariifolium]